MYVCGMTVQDRPHVGHMRYAVSTDAIRRYLESKGIAVNYVTNFTDIDDRIIARANEEGISHEEVSERNIQAFLHYSDVLNLMPATHYPRATRHIPEIVDLIRRLVDLKYAYASGGDVYFEVRRWKRYGELSGRNVDELKSGARIEVGEAKRDPLDFTLWKGAKPGEPAWDSPWGRGRPGWHIECSAMAMKYLGEEFDFHGGGMDLLFPHHENELAQSESCTGKTFVKYWMHNGLTRIKTKVAGGDYEMVKQSKSLGNVIDARELIATHGADLVRYLLLSTHYRSPIDFSPDALSSSKKGLGTFFRLFERVERITGQPLPDKGPDMDSA